MSDQQDSRVGENGRAWARAEVASGRALACGRYDPVTGTYYMYDADGLWFEFDPLTGKSAERRPEADPREMHVILHGVADRSASIAKCYFIGGDEGRIKIGFSVDVPARLRAIQSCSPIDLRILALAPGGADREVAYHAQFSNHRAHGEWFERHPDILAEIERIGRVG